jgi:GT2 family glycosyltransferase
MKLSVICPTYNNPMQLHQMVVSMRRIGFFDSDDRELIIVNNGKDPYEEKKGVKVVNCPENKGWEGGLIEGLKVSSGEFVCFQNDDVHIPQCEESFYELLMGEFYSDEGNLRTDIGMVGPVTTTAAGAQSIYSPNTPTKVSEVSWLIFFCVMMRRDVLNEVGFIDDTLPGGDDFDLSIRMRKAGKKVLIHPKTFIIHHGFQTGTRVHGEASKDGGWNSRSMTERTNQALIRKHGFRTWFKTISQQVLNECN